MSRQQVITAQRRLQAIGFEITVDGVLGPNTRDCIYWFKHGHAHGSRLANNSKLTPRTMRALEWSVEHGGACSPHFKYRTWRSNGNHEIKIHRAVVRALEETRRRCGNDPIHAFSGYRDPHYNDVVIKGASKSQHKIARALDIPIGDGLRLSQVRRLGIWSGIGIQSGTGQDPLVRHLDLRHTGPWNFTRGTPRNPTVWWY